MTKIYAAFVVAILVRHTKKLQPQKYETSIEVTLLPEKKSYST